MKVITAVHTDINIRQLEM